MPINIQRSHRPRDTTMRSIKHHENPSKLQSQDGKSKLGCIFSLLILGAVAFAGVQILPPYYSGKSLETDVKAEVARAGANFMDDETVMNNVLSLARKNEIRIARENVKVERFAGQMFVTIRYTVPLDFFVYKTELPFEIKASSYIGRL